MSVIITHGPDPEKSGQEYEAPTLISQQPIDTDSVPGPSWILGQLGHCPSLAELSLGAGR